MVRITDIVKRSLNWNVITEDNGKIVTFNIFNNGCIDDLLNRIKKNVKNNSKYNKQLLKEDIYKWGHYYYWCRAEHEILVMGLFNNELSATKLDIWYQIEMNLDNIVEYLNNKLKIIE